MQFPPPVGFLVHQPLPGKTAAQRLWRTLSGILFE